MNVAILGVGTVGESVAKILIIEQVISLITFWSTFR